ncbi:hypothetical protein [Streptomyces filamentosus]|uniref:hypothetical protein n=1 Tax=Streptomyces filamentosus TaxID=67294 RepID=UPI00123C3C5C|nr:hypothetical protein [Streptomyces filamentosus]KAA6217033.1 hypothetical protein CP979_08810 [Streptomyces filamentosus]
MRTKPMVAGVLAAAAVLLPAGAARADETHTHNGPAVTNGPALALHTGQIDDPLEDVLEHAAILGRTHTTDSA